MFIEKKKDFQNFENLFHTIFLSDYKSFPQQVFKEGFGNFVFDEFDWTEGREFWDISLKELGKCSGDTEVIVMIPEDNDYVTTFGFYTTIKIPLTCTGDDYWKILHAQPIKGSGYEPWLLAEKMVWMSSSGKWAIWGERSYGMCVLGFAKDSDIKTLRDIRALGFAQYSSIKAPPKKGWWEITPDVVNSLVKNSFRRDMLDAFKVFSDIFIKNYSKS